MDKASYDQNPLNSRTQSTKDVDAFELNIDSELDILYAVTGVSNVALFGEIVTGRDALTIAVETNLKGVLGILSLAKERYEAKLPMQFEWVDNIQRVKDRDTIEILNLELDAALKDPAEMMFWLGEPEVIDWESQLGYSFDQYAQTARHVVLRLEDLAAYLTKKGLLLTTESLKSQSIHVNNTEFQVTKTWSAYRCLYAELPLGAEQYILRNGLWFRVEKKFADEVTAYLSEIQSYSHKLPAYNHGREEDYNKEVSDKDPTFHLMDKKTVQIGGPYDKVEFCDLIKDGTDLVHVKYYRSSSTLSHLFAQGYVAAEAFVKDGGFRERLNNKLPKTAQLKDAKARPDPAGYRVVYAIATSKKLPTELPFFSKITLKNAFRTLRALGFRVELAAIAVDPGILVTKKIKPK